MRHRKPLLETAAADVQADDGLTRRQREVRVFIEGHVRELGVPPTRA